MISVRDGQSIAPCCDECGCRLETIVNSSVTQAFAHYDGSDPEHDARGCACKKISEVWFVDDIGM